MTIASYMRESILSSIMMRMDPELRSFRDTHSIRSKGSAFKERVVAMRELLRWRNTPKSIYSEDVCLSESAEAATLPTLMRLREFPSV